MIPLIPHRTDHAVFEEVQSGILYPTVDRSCRWGQCHDRDSTRDTRCGDHGIRLWRLEKSLEFGEKEGPRMHVDVALSILSSVMAATTCMFLRGRSSHSLADHRRSGVGGVVEEIGSIRLVFTLAARSWDWSL